MTTKKKVLPDPVWIEEARKYIGLMEIVGAKHNPTILSWWQLIKLNFKTDEIPWCMGFVMGMMALVGYPTIPTAWARDGLKYGVKLDKPAYGCIVVFERGSGGHVGFVVGKDTNGNLMVLGGNQANGVNIKPFDARLKANGGRVLGYRWPGKWPLPERFDLPLLTSDGKLSTNEA